MTTSCTPLNKTGVIEAAHETYLLFKKNDEVAAKEELDAYGVLSETTDILLRCYGYTENNAPPMGVASPEEIEELLKDKGL